VGRDRSVRIRKCRLCEREFNSRGSWVCARCDHKRRDKEKENATTRLRNQRYKRDDPEKVRARKRREREIAKAKRHAAGGLTKAEIQAMAVERRAQERKEREDRRKAEIEAKPWLDPALSGAERWRLRYAIDPIFNMQERFRAHQRRGRFGPYAKLGCRLRDAMVRGKQLTASHAPLIDYTAQELREHLEAQFTDGMTWSAFCEGRIHIDHRIPLNTFDMTNPDKARTAWAMDNLQPLWGPDNQTKGRRMPDMDIVLRYWPQRVRQPPKQRPRQRTNRGHGSATIDPRQSRFSGGGQAMRGWRDAGS